MLEIRENTKIYALAPCNVHTGGVELVHQLVDYLRNKNHNCYIVYYDKNGICDAKIVESYVKYNIESITKIEDDKNNILIIPESVTSYIRKYNNIRIGLWWMSVDNYCGRAPYLDLLRYKFSKGRYLSICGQLLFFWKKRYFVNCTTKYMRRNEDRIISLYQSVYAQHFLLKNKFRVMLPLSDYINIDLMVESSFKERENIILYNPRKGLRFTKWIIKKLPEYTFIPLIDMNRQQLVSSMQQAKVYIDFGNHPGKDRLPRESAINGCCLVVGLEGAAAYFEDIAIPYKYKFGHNSSDVDKICDRIKQIIENYSSSVIDYDYYRNRIKKEKALFFDQIDSVFNL